MIGPGAWGATGGWVRPWLPLLLLLLVWAAPLGAQNEPVPAPADTTARDTVIVPIPATGVSPDTLPPDSLMRSAGDSARAAVFPRYENRMPTGWAHGRWEWGPDVLRTHSGFTLLELLERVPGLTVIRSGDNGYPVGITALGLGGGRVRLFVDGFEIDPLGFTAADVQRLGTIDVESLRVEREPLGLRVELTTVRLPEGRPHSVVEAGTGVYDSKLLRGVLVRGLGGRSILSAAYEAVGTDGFAFAAPFSLVAARAAWSYSFSDLTGIQAEFRSTGVERLGARYPENADHRILLVRGRSEIAPGMVVDAALGHATRRPAEGDPLSVALSSTQAMLRGSYSSSRLWTELSLRARDSELEASAAPRYDASARAALTPLPGLSLDGELRVAPLGGAGGVGWQATGRTGLLGATLFATVAGGEAGLALVRDTTLEGGEPGSDEVEPRYAAEAGSVGAVRLGAERIFGPLTLGAAAVRLPASRLVPFGAAFDRGLEAVDGGAASGVEGFAAVAVPGLRDLARLEGWASYWPDTGDRPFLPEVDARGALILQGLFFDGQLEPRLRFEAAHRGAMRVRTSETGTAGASSTPYTITRMLVQIRILDVQAFGLWENFLDNRRAADLPAAPLPGLRLVYGLRWVFRN